jgi:TRAP transporter 4TM/12TM fusion protein
LVVETVRRTVGWSMIVLAVLFVIHALFANHFPGALFGPPVSVENLLITLIIGDAGIFGVPLLVVAQYIVLFLLFGQLLQQTGAGAFFSRLAFALFGHRSGGPAKAAVVSSALFGTLSGSGVSNVLTTGSFTIPMMARLGYRPAFAGGVEASAAVGGAIMPPVMGAVAFMMAEFMGVPYVDIAIAAAIPALLYYLAIYWTVHFEARRLGLPAIARGELPNPLAVLRREGFLAIPLLTIVVLMLAGYSIIKVSIFATAATFLISFVRRGTWLTPSRIVEAAEATGRSVGTLTATCACAGIIIGAIFATGLSFQVSQAVIALAQQQLWLLLIVSALIALVLGTGLTASAVYITMVATVIPILKLAGVPDMAGHMFAFYYGVVSDITPPTALAAVAASAIARANPVATMLEASRLGIAAFIVPFLFVASPALLMIGSPLEIALASGTAALGLFALAAALAGFLRAPLALWQRAALLASSICLIVPRAAFDFAGIAMLLIVALPQWLGRHRQAIETGAAAPDDLRRFLRDAETRTTERPSDATLWLAWASLIIPVAAIGLMGRASLHATHPLLWLGSLAMATLVTLIFLVWSYRRFDGALPSTQAAVEGEGD